MKAKAMHQQLLFKQTQKSILYIFFLSSQCKLHTHMYFGNQQQQRYYKHPHPKRYTKVCFYDGPTGNQTWDLRYCDTKRTGVRVSRTGVVEAFY